MEKSGNTPFQQLSNEAWRIPKDFLEPRTKTHVTFRWIGTLVISLIFCLRLYYTRGFHVIRCGLLLYLSNLYMGSCIPRVGNKTGPNMAKPYVPLLPEFDFWYSATLAVCITFLLSFFPSLDIPWVVSVDVFYGICSVIIFAYLHIYWLYLFMRQSIIPQDDGRKKSRKKSSKKSS